MTNVEAKTVLLKDHKSNNYIIPFVPNATASSVGLAKPDGSTITIDGNGTMSANLSDLDSRITELENHQAEGGASIGSWVFTNHREVFNSTNLGNLSIDLTNVLPSGNSFDLLISIYADTSDVSNVYPLVFPVNLRNIEIAENVKRTFNLYAEGSRSNIVYQFETNAINYIQTQGGCLVPLINSKVLYGKLSGQDNLKFKSFKVFLDGYRKLG